MPSVLLLNDRFDREWRVSVDGQSGRLLRCNFIMRGVQVPAGQHTVVFQFQPSLKGLKISLIAVALGMILCGLLFFVRQPEEKLTSNTSASANPQPNRPTSRK
jgi:uncharacterized membrane protein YfhO